MTGNRTICEVCTARPAVINYTRHRNEDSHSLFMCLECARDRARLDMGSALDPARVLTGSRLLGDNKRTIAGACAICGTVAADIMNDGKPGCCFCYSHFPSEIEGSVLAVQGRTRHSGKHPGR